MVLELEGDPAPAELLLGEVEVLAVGPEGDVPQPCGALAATAYVGVRAGIVASLIGRLLVHVFVTHPRFRASVDPE